MKGSRPHADTRARKPHLGTHEGNQLLQHHQLLYGPCKGAQTYRFTTPKLATETHG